MSSTDRQKEFDQEMRLAAQRVQHAWHIEDQPERLLAFTAQWREAGAIRSFLEALERQATPPPASPLADWIGWARRYADTHDPLSAHGLKRIEQNAEAVADASRDDARPTREDWEWYGCGFLRSHLEELVGDE